VAAVDCGKAINPQFVEGQCEGSILNGLSYALTEEFIFNERGKMLNSSFGRYKIYSAPDIPEIKSVIVPSYEPTGPYGAKPVGEPVMDGCLPVISNAIKNAIGVRLTEAPFSLEKIIRALKEKKN